MYIHNKTRRFIRSCCIAFLLVCMFASASAIAGLPSPGMDGNWKGVITIPDGPTIELFLEFFTTAEGEDRAFLRIPAQNVGPMIVDNLTIDGETFRFELVEDNGIYEGKLERGKRITGTWTQNGTKLELNFTCEAP